jgi:hypothetical protein
LFLPSKPQPDANPMEVTERPPTPVWLPATAPCTAAGHPTPWENFRGCRRLGIPVKLNVDSGRKPNGIPEEGEQQSERSDAGLMIVE